MFKELFPIRSTVTRLALATTLLIGSTVASGCESSPRVLQGKSRPGVVQEVRFSAFKNDGVYTNTTFRKEPLLSGEEITLDQVRDELRKEGANPNAIQGMRVYGGAYFSGDERGSLARDSNGNVYGGWTAIGYLTDDGFVTKAFAGENGITRGQSVVVVPSSRYKR